MPQAFWTMTIGFAAASVAAAEPGKTPGADWPRVRHDSQLTGLSPLKGGLDRPPREIWSVDLGGPTVGAETVRIEDVNGDGKTEVLRVRKRQRCLPGSARQETVGSRGIDQAEHPGYPRLCR